MENENEKKEEPTSSSPNAKKTNKKRKRNRCSLCNKKLPITAYPCKCGALYCTAHILDHACSYDYQDEYKKKLKTNMPPVLFLKNELI